MGHQQFQSFNEIELGWFKPVEVQKLVCFVCKRFLLMLCELNEDIDKLVLNNSQVAHSSPHF